MGLTDTPVPLPSGATATTAASGGNSLRYCGQDAHNYAAFMGIPREEWDGWANADSAIVHPDYRGNGLQRKLLEVALTLLRPGIVGIGATVSPENQYSLNNALASGFEIVCRREMYGGYDRYLLAKALSVTSFCKA